MANDLDKLSKDQIIKKLAELPWEETRTGIPGIGMDELSPADYKLLRDSAAHGIVYYMPESTSLKGEGYYTYNPELIGVIEQKDGFEVGFSRSDREYSASKKREMREFVKEIIPTLAQLMTNHGRRVMDGGDPGQLSRIDVHDEDTVDTIFHEFGKHEGHGGYFNLIHRALRESEGGGVRFKMNEGNIGTAIAGHIYLSEREQQRGEGWLHGKT